MRGRKLFLLAVVAMVAVSVAAPAVASPSEELGFDGDTHAPNPRIDVDTLTVAKHPMSEGTSHDAMAGYYDDNGDWVANPQFVVNTTSSESSGTNVNPYAYRPGHIEEDSYGEFPRRGSEETSDSDDNQASILDASEWSKSGAQSSELTISDTTVAQNVDAVSLATGGSFTSSDVAVATYNNWTSQLDSDESKRVMQIGMDLDTLDSGARVNISAVDESGDYKEVLIEPTESDRGVNATTGFVATGDQTYQVKLSALSTNGGGSFDNIEEIVVTVKDGDFTGEISWFDLAQKGKTELGDRMVDDADSDSDYDNINSTYNTTGTTSTYDIDTLDAKYDDAVLTDVQFPAQFSAAEMDGTEGEEDDYVVYWEDAEAYPSYDHVLNMSVRMDAPAAIDLSYSGMDVDLPQSYPSGRYITAGYESDIKDDANLSQLSLTDQTGSLGEPGDIINFVAGASSDTNYGVQFELKLTDSERDAIENTGTESGGAGQFAQDSGGGWVDTILGVPGMIVSALLVALGLKRKRG